MEIEIKYAPVSYAQFVAIADDLGLTDEEIIRMSADYFDTADGFLSENKISLRRRTENDISVYTMKCSLRNIGGVAVREEEEIATDDINLAFDHFAKNPRLAALSAASISARPHLPPKASSAIKLPSSLRGIQPWKRRFRL